ncbi:MAG: aldehyde dehydrogenase [Alphaproteobacteria bacterium]|nr:aldehyde dehydrogenase [Alphaproteobacteria bacterium]
MADLDRREVMKALLGDRGELLVVPGLGSATWDAAAADGSPQNFYLWGAMGGAAMIGLGLALAQPTRPVAVITGDGEQLMGLGGMATIGVRRPKNLTLVVLDNRHFGETGMQQSHTGLGADLCGVARACNFDWVADAADMAGVGDIRARFHAMAGCGFARIPIAAVDHERVLPEHDGVKIKNSFRAAIGLG